jgi:hypothetical protein
MVAVVGDEAVETEVVEEVPAAAEGFPTTTEEMGHKVR